MTEIPKLDICVEIRQGNKRYSVNGRDRWLTEDEAAEVIRCAEAYEPWIPVSERLPNLGDRNEHDKQRDDGTINVFGYDSDILFTTNYYPKMNVWNGLEPTHWKPIILPEKEAQQRPYRGKRKDNGEWVYGWYFHGSCNNTHWLHLLDESKGNPVVEVDPATVGQQVGRDFHDQDGRHYYEGSLVRGVKCKYNDSGEVGVVYYNHYHAAYWVQARDKSYNVPLGHMNWCLLIGNIHSEVKE